MWAYESVFYQIYPLGACGAPFENDGKKEKRLTKLDVYIPHLKKLGVKGVLFNPLFDSDTHGYNTRDYRQVDNRLGDNEDFVKLVNKLHDAGIKVIIDAVFNHVGRGFWGFKDVLEKREASEYKDWFCINFGGNDAYNDGLWYEGWEGNYDLVKLNLSNPAVSEYLYDTVRYWIDTFDIDGLRLDVAYCLDKNFIRRLRYESSQMKEDFFLMGEMIGGDYRTICGEGLCDSATNYECYKGLFSSMNSYNLFEITHSLLRQFGPENWTLYRGMHLWSFVDNHDVTRVSSILSNPEHVKLIYALTKPKFAIPVHGEFRHLKRHAELAREMGVDKDNVVIMSNGNVLELSADEAQIIGNVTSQGILVDGLGVGDVGNIVLRDRQHLSQNGLIIVVVTLEKHSNMLVAGPDIVSRGFVYVRESEYLMDEARNVVYAALERCLDNQVSDWSKIKTELKDSLSDFLWKKMKRNPMILPVTMEVE